MSHRWHMKMLGLWTLASSLSSVGCGEKAQDRAGDELAGSGGALGMGGAGASANDPSADGGEPAAGTDGAGVSDDDDDDATRSTAPGGPYCIISADCAAGMFCDLGECISLCSADRDCGAGLVCSERGRCLEPRAEDRDPEPVTEKLGTVTVEPTSVRLTEHDTELKLTLETDSDEPIGYRVELLGPHLSLAEPRGEIGGSTTLTIEVDPDRVQDVDAFGTVHVYTDLGDLVVDAPIQVGLDDTYEGVLRYESGGAPFGSASMMLELQEYNGEVEVRVDPKRSLLFPKTLGTAGGRGFFTVSDGLEFTVTQLIGPDVGGARNHLARPLGRRLTFVLGRTAEGNWEGAFEERIYGLFVQPITLHGTAFFSRSRTENPVTFELGELDDMPIISAEALPDPEAVFGWSWDSCERGARQFSDCRDINGTSCLEAVEEAYYGPLFDALRANLTSPEPLSDLRGECEQEMFASAALGERRSCAVIPPLGCGLRSLVNTVSPTMPLVPETFARLYAKTLAPALFVAQDHIVEGFRQSLIEGSSAQAKHYQDARAALDQPLRWLLHPAILEYLRRMPASGVMGNPNAEDPTERNYPALRALSRALYVLSLLDKEQARLGTAATHVKLEDQLEESQVSALLSFLDAAALAELHQNWEYPPVGGEFSGFLSELSRGFAALTQGALSFGVPDGEIGFVYDPARSEPTNFEQMLRIHATPALSQFQADEQAFLEAERAYDQNQALLQQELERVRTDQDETLRRVCGSNFEPDEVEIAADWTTCGADGTGEIAELSLDIEQAHLRMQAGEGRVLAANRKIDIDLQRLADTQNVHKKTLKFIDDSGRELEGLVIQETALNAIQSAMQVAANSNVLNAGAPAAMGAAVALIEGMRGQINRARQHIQTVKEMRFEQAGAEIELINGMADIQRQLVDVTQLELELSQDGLAIAQANLRRANALDTAQRIHLERQRTLARILNSSATDPLHRVLQDQLALKTMDSRAKAQRWLYRAGRALEYEVNMPLGEALGRAVLGAHNSREVNRLSTCYQNIFSEYATAYGVPQEFSTTLSLRKMLGVTEPRQDWVTGEELSEGELFRRALLTNQTLDSDGSVKIQFSTNLLPGNGLWSTTVCDDRVASIKAQLVGDFQGDDEAEIQLQVDGIAIMRRCDSEELIHWGIDQPATAVIQAGVNGFGLTQSTSLFGQSVARASWTLVIPSPIAAPANSDLDLEQLEDIVLEISHRALPRREGGARVDASCLGSVGAGG